MKTAGIPISEMTMQNLQAALAARQASWEGVQHLILDENGQYDEDRAKDMIQNLENQESFGPSTSENAGDLANALENIDQVVDDQQAVPPLQQMAKRKVFNLKKSAQIPGMGFDETQPNVADDEFRAEQNQLGAEEIEQGIEVEPKGIADTLNLLENVYQSPVEFVEAFRHRVNPEVIDDFEKLVSVFYEDIKGKPIEQIDKEQAAEQIFEAMSNDEGLVDVPATWQQSAEANSMHDIIKESQEQIKKLASAYGKKKTAKSFNLKKEAQHHTDQNVIMWGPDEKRIDPYLRQPVSDWHILERNKGVGQDIDGVWDVDWEAIWRGTVMDKYSRPYRDTKTGEWIGGYIQKRFEVDKNIPEQNNMQLLPGQLRKPRLAEQGVIEGRLQAMRAKDDRGYGPQTNTDAPYDWNVTGDKEYAKIANSYNGMKHASKDKVAEACITPPKDAEKRLEAAMQAAKKKD